MWATMAAPLAAGKDATAADATQEEVEERVKITLDIIQSCFFQADVNTGERLDQPLFDDESVKLLSSEEFQVLAEMASKGAGLTEEVSAVAGHFRDEQG
jgi:hypothetical protein